MRYKILIILLAFMFLIPSVFAEDIIKYDKEKKQVTINDTNGKLAELQLIETHESIGIFRAKFRLQFTKEKVLSKKDSDYSWDIKNFYGNIKELKFKIEEKYNITIPDTKSICNPFELPNRSIEQNCSVVKTADKNIELIRLIEIDPYKLKYKKDDNIIFWIEAERDPALGTKSGDISPTLLGHDLTNYFVWWNATFDYCTNLNISVDGTSYTGPKPITRWVNTSSLTPQPYNESVRIVNMPCNNGGQELPSSFLPWLQNSTGHTNYARLVIFPNGTVSSNITYSMYYNFNVTPIMVYSTDLSVRTNGTTNTYMKDDFSGGSIIVSNYLQSTDNGNNAAGGNSIDGFSITGANVLTTGAGSCSLKWNSSMTVVFNCSNTAEKTELLHYYFAYSPIKQIQVRSFWTSTSSLYDFGRPNGSTSGTYTLLPFNTSETTATFKEVLARGQCAHYSTGMQLMTGYLYNMTKNQTVTRISASDHVGCQPIGANNPNATDTWGGNMSFVTRVYVTGPTESSMYDNVTDYWTSYIKNQNEIIVGATQLTPTTPPNVTIQSPANTTYNTSQIALNYSVNETATCQYELNGAANVSLGSCINTTFTAVVGSNTIKVFATDIFSNVGFASVSFTYTPVVGPVVFTYNVTSNVTQDTFITDDIPLQLRIVGTMGQVNFSKELAYGNYSRLISYFIYSTGLRADLKTFMQFNNSAVQSRLIKAVRLRMQNVDNSCGGNQANKSIYFMRNDSWNESTLTFNNHGSLGTFPTYSTVLGKIKTDTGLQSSSDLRLLSKSTAGSELMDDFYRNSFTTLVFNNLVDGSCSLAVGATVNTYSSNAGVYNPNLEFELEDYQSGNASVIDNTLLYLDFESGNYSSNDPNAFSDIVYTYAINKIVPLGNVTIAPFGLSSTVIVDDLQNKIQFCSQKTYSSNPVPVNVINGTYTYVCVNLSSQHNGRPFFGLIKMITNSDVIGGSGPDLGFMWALTSSSFVEFSTPSYLPNPQLAGVNLTVYTLVSYPLTNMTMFFRLTQGSYVSAYTSVPAFMLNQFSPTFIINSQYMVPAYYEIYFQGTDSENNRIVNSSVYNFSVVSYPDSVTNQTTLPQSLDNLAVSLGVDSQTAVYLFGGFILVLGTAVAFIFGGLKLAVASSVALLTTLVLIGFLPFYLLIPLVVYVVAVIVKFVSSIFGGSDSGD